MGLNKVTYTDGSSVIHASNLNDIQDEVIANASSISTKQAATDSSLSTSAKTVVGAINEVKSSVSDVVDVINRYASFTLATSDWTSTTYNSESCYAASKTMSGSTEASSHPFVGLAISSQAAAEDEITAFNMIYEAYAGDNTITFYATDKPETNFTVQVKGW